MKNIFTKIRNSKESFKTWTKFDDSDPFSFVLEDLKKDENGYVVWNKYFIHKYGKINDKNNIMKNVLKAYSTNEIKNLLKKSEFSKIQFFKNFELEKYDPKQDEYVVLAKK